MKAQSLRRLLVAAGLLACGAMICVQDACVLAEPSGALPRLPDARPVIVHTSLVPSASNVLTVFPSEFLVPVELIDPTVDFMYAGFIDYNPLTGAGRVTDALTSHFDPDNVTGRTRTLQVSLPVPVDLDRCHVIEVVVALRFDALSTSMNIHTPAAPGGDIATWFYNPTGGPGGCPSLDALDADVADGDAEGGVP